MFFNTFKAEIDDSESVKKIHFHFEFFGVAKPVIRGFVNGILVGISEKKLSGMVTFTEDEFPEFFVQGTILEAYLNNTQTHQEIRSPTIRFMVILKPDPRNSVYPPPIAYIAESTVTKSMMMPPVASCKGKVFHFKYLGSQKSFTLLSAIKNRPYPTQQSELIPLENDDLSAVLDCQIEGAWSLNLSVQNQCVSIVSDGIEWLVVNNYEGTFSSICKGSLPDQMIYEKNKSHFLNYYWNTDSSNNIMITDLRQHSLKFLHVHRFLPDTGFLNIYAPQGVGIEEIDVSGGEYAYLSICLSNKALLSNTASFVFSFFNNRLYILSQYDGAGFKVANYSSGPSVSLENTLTIAAHQELFRLPSIRSDKQETKLFIIKNKSSGRFVLETQEKGSPNIYTPKNGLRDCITYTRPLNKFCFWVIVYYDHGLEGQTTAVIMNKYNHEK